jgi:hypothetical protein
VITRLGGGALTEVHLCRLQGVEGFEKEVVVKRLLPEAARDALFVRNFLAEARVVARLSHRSIVQVFEVGEGEDGPHVAMEYVKGVTAALITSRAHYLRKVHYGHFANLTAGLCDGLAYAHGARDDGGAPLGVVHWDVSPRNILVSMEGIPKLTDFGTTSPAKRLLETSETELERHAEVFSVGVTLFELTTGVIPFVGEGQTDLPRPSAIVPGYPPELERIVMSAVAPDATNLSPSVDELRDRLEEFASSPTHRSNPSALMRWLRDLVPELAPPPRSTLSAGPTPPGGVPTEAPSTTRVTHGEEPTVAMRGVLPPAARRLGVDPPTSSQPGPYARPPSPARGNGVWKWAALVAMAAAAGAGVMAVRRQQPPSPIVAVAPPPAPVPRAEQEAKRYVTPEESLARDRKPEPVPPERAEAGKQPAPPLAATDPASSTHRLERRRPSRRASWLSRRHPAGSASAFRPAPGVDPFSARDPVPPLAPRPAAEGDSRTAEPPATSGGPATEPVPRSPAMAQAPSGVSSAPAAPRSASPAASTVERPTERPPAAGGIVSATPKSPVPIPALPRVFTSQDVGQLARVCQAVEATAVSQAGVSPEFARGVTGPLRRLLQRQTPIYPIAMYYFLVREAALKHDSATAAANLAAAQSSGAILRFKDLPGIERNP